MSDWYCSSVAWSAVAQFAISTAYNVGDLIRQLATPTVGNERVFRCTTAGTTAGSEPSWTLTKSGTTTSNTAVFTEITGNSARQRENGATTTWTAPHARIENMCSWMAAGDTGYVSSDHTQTKAGSTTFTSPGLSSGVGTTKFLSVTKAGSVPPVAADITNGAACAINNTRFASINVSGSSFWQGFTFTGSAGAEDFQQMGFAGTQGIYIFKNCSFVHGSSSASGNTTSFSQTSGANVIIDGCTFSYANNGQVIQFSTGEFNVIAPVFAGTAPTYCFQFNASGNCDIRNADFSAFSGTTAIIYHGAGTSMNVRILDCKLSGTVKILAAAMSGGAGSNVQIDVVNCDSGAHGYHNEHHDVAGDITTETTIVRTLGTSDGTTKTSRKFVTTAACSPAFPLREKEYSIWNTTTGSSVTATIEIQSATSLNNDQIWAEFDYLGSSSFPIGTEVSTLPATILTTAAAVTTSAAAWDSTVGSPVVYQKLAATFTPNMVGMVIARVRLGKASQTVYVDPKITLS